MAQNDRVRQGRFAGLTQGAADLAAAAQRYGDEWGGKLGQQVLAAAKQAAQAHQEGQRIYGEGLIAASQARARQPLVSPQVIGKIRAAPSTALGLAAALPEMEGALLSGRWPEVRVRDNALQFLNVPTKDSRAYTLGNTQFYAPGRRNHPDWVEPSYSGAEMRIGDHEGGHSDQFEEYGLSFWPKWLRGGGPVKTNPVELDADRRGLERARRRAGR